jgi:uncharacterized OB-fold protein
MTNDAMPDLVCPDALRRTASGWTLLGSRCKACGEMFFPQQRSCARCCGIELESCELGAHGTLWSWTIQGFLPKPPYDGGVGDAAFQPYGVGYIQMPAQLKVESRLTVNDPAQLRIGMPMQLTLDPYRQTADGRTIFTFAFKPSNGRNAGAPQ